MPLRAKPHASSRTAPQEPNGPTATHPNPQNPVVTTSPCEPETAGREPEDALQDTGEVVVFALTVRTRARS